MTPPKPARRTEVGPALVRDLLLEGLAVRLRVTGRSMAPQLVDDDEVTLRRCDPAALRVGDLVLSQEPGLPAVLHRVVRRRREPDGGWTFVTKGDALNAPDRPIRGEWVAGRVEEVRPRRGRAGAVRLVATLARRLAARLSAARRRPPA